MVASGRWLQALTRRVVQRGGAAIAIAGMGLLAMARPSPSAEEIIITYGFFERTIAIKDLVAFAEGAPLSDQLSQYARSLGIPEAEIEALRPALNRRVELDTVEIAQFLYTEQGETLLTFLGEVIQTPTRQSGFLALRAGIILASADEEDGLTLLNFLEEYPTPAIRVNVGRGLEIAGAVTETLNQSERAIALVRSRSAIAAEDPDNSIFIARQLLNDPAPYQVSTQALNLPQRRVSATLYLPRSTSQRVPLPDEIPVIVISHGLGDQRASYDYLARNLAQRGFAVATLDHPGSNSKQISDLLRGLSPEIVANREFLNRPEDVSALLDEIQRYGQRTPMLRQRLNVQNVGVIGQSFGGYTALAVAGATFNPDTLAAACEPRPIYLNPSLLLQCQAQDITADRPELMDDRVQAILVVNPVGSALFGPSGYGAIEVPTMIVAATADTVAPALPEQIEPFSWLQTRDRYLALMSESTHFSVIAADPNAASIPVPEELLGSSPELSQRYLQTLSLAFFQRHLRQDERYGAALTAGYLKTFVEQPPVQPLDIIQDLTPEGLAAAIAGD